MQSFIFILFCYLKSPESDRSEPYRLTKAEQLRMEAKGLKQKVKMIECQITKTVRKANCFHNRILLYIMY